MSNEFEEKQTVTEDDHSTEANEPISNTSDLEQEKNVRHMNFMPRETQPLLRFLSVILGRWMILTPGRKRIPLQPHRPSKPILCIPGKGAGNL